MKITPNFEIGNHEFTERMVKASGPGGQHVNKTSNAVELRFDVGASNLPDDVRARLRVLAGARLTQDDVLILFSQGSRSLEMNRQDVRERLADLIRRALQRPKSRRPTKPSYASKLKRLEGKTRRSGIKSMRGKPPSE